MFEGKGVLGLGFLRVRVFRVKFSRVRVYKD